MKINKITYKEEPTLFDDIVEFSIESKQDHRRGSNFYRTEVIEFKEEHEKWYPKIDNFKKYLGIWRTNCVIWDANYGFDETFSELTRVERKEVITYEYVNII